MMNLLEHISITLTDGNGTVIVPESADAVLKRTDLDRGYLLTLDAACPAGFADEDSIVVRFDVPDTGDWLAIANHSQFWCRPQWGESLRDLPVRTQELLLRDEDGYLCLLPLCGDTFKSLLRGDEERGGLILYALTNCEGVTACRAQPSLLVMRGEEPLSLLRDTAAHAAEILGIPLRTDRKVHPLFDLLGWCSWDALQIRVSHKGLMDKVNEFREKHVPIGFAIIDDMWADVPGLNDVPADTPFRDMCRIMHASRMNDFAGDPVRFPDGMGAAIADMKAAGIPHVGIWFPTTGYWSGLVPEGPLAQALQTHTVVNESEQILVNPTEEDATAVYGEFCDRVKAWGADFVKIDNQGVQKRYHNVCPIGQSASALQRAIDKVTKERFDGALINCMGMPSECMFHRPHSAISRCSDDFIPESRAWFAKNILQCAYNGVLQGQFYTNDWDMWWTDDEQARKNSLCRAVSGGPIYVSDKIGRTRPEILRPLCLSDGRILRCDESATPTADCLLTDPTVSGNILKIRNRKGAATLAAIFNVDAENRSVHGTLSPAETGQDPSCAYLWTEFFTGACGVIAPGKSMELTLCDNDTFRLYTFLPLNTAAVATVLGRRDLMIGVGAVVSQVHTETETVATLLEGGEVWFYAPTPVRVYAGDTELSPRACGIDGFWAVRVDEDVCELKFVRE